MIANILTKKAKVYQIKRNTNANPMKRTGNVTKVNEVELLGEIKCQIYTSKKTTDATKEAVEDETIKLITKNDRSFNKKMIIEFEEQKYRVTSVKKYRSFANNTRNNPVVLEGILYDKKQ